MYIFYTITVTPNPYPRSITFFFCFFCILYNLYFINFFCFYFILIFFCFFLLSCKNDPPCKIVTRAKLTFGRNCPLVQICFCAKLTLCAIFLRAIYPLNQFCLRETLTRSCFIRLFKSNKTPVCF